MGLLNLTRYSLIRLFLYMKYFKKCGYHLLDNPFFTKEITCNNNILQGKNLLINTFYSAKSLYMQLNSLYVHFSIAIILMGKRELIALLNLSSWCLVMVEQLFFTVPRGCLQFVIVVFPDHNHLLFLHD